MATKKGNTANRGTGKRKEAIARVSLKAGKGDITVNGKPASEYFGNISSIYKKINTPFEICGALNQYDVSVNVRGGGKIGQGEATMYGIAKALIALNPELRKQLKEARMLTRDARIKESKKYGRKKARKKFQFSKR